MKKETFDRIWSEAIKPVIECEYDRCKNADTNGRFGFSMLELNKLSNGIKRDYEVVRQHLKSRYYKAKNDEEEENLIDVHKIAACLSYSILCNKPFSFAIKDRMPQEIFLSNYTVAYHAGLAFILMTLISEYAINGYKVFSDKLKEKGRMMEPPVSRGHDDYNKGRIYALGQNDIYGNTFDILGYADMMFWVEYYTRQMIEGTVCPVDLDRKMYEE